MPVRNALIPLLLLLGTGPTRAITLDSYGVTNAETMTLLTNAQLFGAGELGLAKRIQRWVPLANSEEIKILGKGEPGKSDSVSLLRIFARWLEHDEVDEVLYMLDEIVARLPIDRSGHWRVWRANLHLRAGALDLAREDALAARALGVDLCQQGCPSSVERWLADESLPPATESERSANIDLYDLRESRCPPDTTWDQRPVWELQSKDLMVAAHQSLAKLATEIVPWWEIVAAGCSNRAYVRIRPQVDALFPAQSIQASYTAALAQATQSPRPEHVEFLGLRLALPRSECDFSVDSACSVQRPLSNGSASTLVQQLRLLSDLLQSPTPKTAEAPDWTDWRERYELRSAFAARLAELEGLIPGIGLPKLRAVLEESAFADLGEARTGHQVRKLLEGWLVSVEDAPDALQLWKSELARSSWSEEFDDKRQLLLARLQLLSLRPNDALNTLREANVRSTSPMLSRIIVWLE